jgi:tRNA U34 5-carboxymethylaminomethyl modifying GTPase MnmE/TrmE
MVRTRARTYTAIAGTLAAAIALAAPALAAPPAKPPAEKPADKPAREPVSDADAQRYLSFFEKLVAIVVANQNDCARMAAAIDAHVEANQALVKEVAEAKNRQKELPPAVKAKIQQKVKDELQPALQKCVQDKAVKAALERLQNPKLDRPRRSPPLEKD